MSAFVNNPIKNDQTALFSSGGGGGASVTLNNTYPPVQDNTGASDSTAATTTVARSLYVLANDALPSSTTTFATGAASVVQLGNAISGLKIGTAITPSGAAGGYTAISESGKDLYLRGVKNPVVLGGAITNDTTAFTTTVQNMSIRVWTPFTINSNIAMPFFSVNAMGSAGSCTFDIIKNNGSSIYSSTKPVINFVATPSPANHTTEGTQAGNSKGVLTTNPTTFAVGDLITFRLTYSPTAAGGGTWLGAKGFIVIG